MITVALIRHGKTAGNVRHAYIGTTDEWLFEGENAAGFSGFPPVEKVFSSPLQRCVQTAALIYPAQSVDICEELRECDFGDFEGKNYAELKENCDYKAWMESGGQLAFPHGENGADFRKRCVRGFLEIIRASQPAKTIAIVCHGGTIMAILERFSERDFYSWQVENLGGFVFEFDEEQQKTLQIRGLYEWK